MKESHVELLQPLLRSLETGSVYALAALGIIIVWRTSLVMHFAQGAMGMFSGTAVAFVLNRTGSPLWVAVLAGAVVAILLGFAVDLSLIHI
jgi:branched-chain amino acid transport system permease protein